MRACGTSIGTTFRGNDVLTSFIDSKGGKAKAFLRYVRFLGLSFLSRQ